jgi:nucleotide-binding universal stress UspA family protein
MTILVPTDFSKCANNAMMYALEIAARTGRSVTALYVVYPNEGVDNNVYDAFFVDNYVQERLISMKKWARKFTKSPHLQDVEIHIECQIGFPVSTIAETAKSLNASIIVMGTTGASGLRGVLLGSVASGVVAGSKTPVFIIPPKAAFRNEARFAFATDFKVPVSQDSLKVMREMLNLQHSGLDVVHVLSDENKQPNPQAEKALSERLGTILHTFHYLHDANVVRAVQNFLEATDCNGLVAVAHEHGLLQKLFGKRVSRALAQQAKVPILVLHDA